MHSPVKFLKVTICVKVVVIAICQLAHERQQPRRIGNEKKSYNEQIITLKVERLFVSILPCVFYNGEHIIQCLSELQSNYL